MNNKGIGILELVLMFSVLGLIILLLMRIIPLSAEAFVLAFAIAIMSYIGIEMYIAYRKARERDKDDFDKL